jgi:DNA repair protein RecO (recombination protein O)
LLAGEALFCGYYLNELLMHLLPREDAHERLFARYTEMLARLAATLLARSAKPTCEVSRRPCLQELGYGLTLNHDSDARAIDTEAFTLTAWSRGRFAWSTTRAQLKW